MFFDFPVWQALICENYFLQIPWTNCNLRKLVAYENFGVLQHKIYPTKFYPSTNPSLSLNNDPFSARKLHV